VVAVSARKHAGRKAIVSVLALAAVLSACSGDRTGGPAASPERVVGQAADLTLAAGTAQVKIQSPDALASGVVDFQAHSGRLTLRAVVQPVPIDVLIAGGAGYARSGPGWQRLSGVVPTVLAGGDPFADPDLLRGAIYFLSDGGAEVDGASTIRYTLHIDPDKAVAATPPDRQPDVRRVLQGRTAPFTADVWIDSAGRARRIEVPTDLRATTPPTRVDRLPIASDVDYVTFGVSVGDITAPAGAG
jgi:hypothetical protein